MDRLLIQYAVSFLACSAIFALGFRVIAGLLPSGARVLVLVLISPLVVLLVAWLAAVLAPILSGFGTRS
jgi:hypothetical protein